MSVQADLEAQYEASKRLVADIEKLWKAEGQPLLTQGGATGRALVAHPLVLMLQAARRDVDRFAKQLAAKHRGPEASAVVRARIGKAPSARLKRVK